MALKDCTFSFQNGSKQLLSEFTSADHRIYSSESYPSGVTEDD